MLQHLEASSRRVVIVEDDADVRESLTFAFEIQGLSVSAYSSAEAMLARNEPLDHCCLVIDQCLPGMNGLALLQRLRELGRDAPAVLITTANREIASQAALARVPLIDKPLMSEMLIGKVQELLGEPLTDPIHQVSSTDSSGAR